MKDFIYRMPTKIYFGRGGQHRAGSLAGGYGKRVLLHYGGGSIKKSGLYDQVVSSLKEAGCEIFELPGAVPNPRLSLCKEGMEICRKQGIDLILAVGGGSVIDSAKCIALGACYEGDVWDVFLGRGENPVRALPIGAIPTLAASGSENNCSMVITDEKTRMKVGIGDPLLFPKFAILNPELTYTIPAYHTAAGAVDAISHALLSYFERGWENELMHSVIESMVKLIIRYTPIALKEPENYEARAQLMWASSLCCNRSLMVGSELDVTTHRLQYQFNINGDTTHGAGIAVTMLGWFKFLKSEVPDRLARLGGRVFGYKYDYAHPERSADECIERFEAFFKDIGMPTRIGGLGVPIAGFEVMARNIYGLIGEYGVVKRCGIKESVELYRLCAQE